MEKVISAGGLVTHGRTLLMLKKRNGHWVLPKGRKEAGESLEVTAVREVKEETNIDGQVEAYIGSTAYKFCVNWETYAKLDKEVHWYKMTALSFDPVPQREEGYIEARFIPLEECVRYARYKEDKTIIQKMLDEYFNEV